MTQEGGQANTEEIIFCTRSFFLRCLPKHFFATRQGSGRPFSLAGSRADCFSRRIIFSGHGIHLVTHYLYFIAVIEKKMLQVPLYALLPPRGGGRVFRLFGWSTYDRTKTCESAGVFVSERHDCHDLSLLPVSPSFRTPHHWRAARWLDFMSRTAPRVLESHTKVVAGGFPLVLLP